MGECEPSKPPYDARSVANYVLDRIWAHGASATQLQLYKIVYFAHGWHLAAGRGPLIVQQFEAWKYGPVVRVLRESFSHYGRNPISAKAERFDIFTGEFIPTENIENKDDLDFISNIVDSYYKYDGWHLSEITHEAGSPWDRVWNSETPVGKLALRLDDSEICSYFVSLPHRFWRH